MRTYLSYHLNEKDLFFIVQVRKTSQNSDINGRCPLNEMKTFVTLELLNMDIDFLTPQKALKKLIELKKKAEEME